MGEVQLYELQIERSLPFPELSGDWPLLPVHTYEYGKRLAYVEWARVEWVDCLIGRLGSGTCPCNDHACQTNDRGG